MSSTFGCPHCGTTNPLNATFCVACGTYLAGLDTGSLARAETQPPSDKSPDKSPDKQPKDKGESPTLPSPATPDTRFQPWLHPNYDKANPQEDKPTPHNQDWLHPQKDDQDSTRPPASAPQRMIGGLQGLIDPADMASGQLFVDIPPASGSMLVDIPYEMRRELRQIFATDVPMLEDPTNSTLHPEPPNGQGEGLWRRNWIYGIVLSAILLGLWAGNPPTSSRPHSWPGVVDAYNTIDTLPIQATVLVNWAYDPSTAGEMDLAARPIIQHLLEKNARLLVVSQLPGGPATARRLLAQVRADAPQTSTARRSSDSLFEGGYLPGGVASLALLGQAPTQGIPVDMRGRAIDSQIGGANLAENLAENNPALLLILAARSEEIQRWIEQVQPLNNAPMIAVGTAAIDPVIRPYVDSGQLSGLVSGYAGGLAYQELLADPIPAARQERQLRHISGQNWGLAMLLLVIFLGNLVGLAQRRTP